ncbi:MAG TPA: hypothetical protein VM934_08945 [Pyrinomonadaceae bacterium]|nr:hypothetical protein [Pyrinomonadaceae bacterium]
MFSLTLPMASQPAAAQSAKKSLAADKGQEVERIIPFKDRLPVGVLRGEAAQQRVNRVRATNKALNRAMKDKERQGKKINWDASGVVVFAKPGAKQQKTAQAGGAMFMNASFAPNQETLSDGTGEATFITYDGSPSTWDGTVYRTDYYTGETEVYNADMYDFGASDDPALWDVTQEIYYPSDGGEPCSSGGGDRGTMYDQQMLISAEPCSAASLPKTHRDALKSSGNAGLFMDASYLNAAPAPRPFGSVFRWFSNFWKCYSRTLAYRGAACISPQPNIRNNLICYISAGIYAAGCCARFAHNNAGRGYCYQ